MRAALFASLLASVAVAQDPAAEQKQEERRLTLRALDNSRADLARLVDMRMRYDLGIIASLDADVVRVDGGSTPREIEQMNHELDTLQAKNTVLAGDYAKVRRLVDELHAKMQAAANQPDPGQFVPVPRQGERAPTTVPYSGARQVTPAANDATAAPTAPAKPVAVPDPEKVLLGALALDPPQAQIQGSADHRRVAQSLFKAGQALLDRAETLRAQGQTEAAQLLDGRGKERLDRALAELEPLLSAEEPPYVALFYQARCLELLFRHDERYAGLALGSADYQRRAQQVRAPGVQITARDMIEEGSTGVPQPGPWSAAAKTAMEHFRWMNINGRYDATDKIKKLTWPGADRQ